MKTLKFKLGLIISIIMLTVFIIDLLYYNSILNDRAQKSSIQILSSLGIEHELNLLNEIENTKAKSDILALIFSKKIKNKKLNTDSYKLISSVLENSPNISGFTIAYIGQEVIADSLLKGNDYINEEMNYLNVNRNEKGISFNTNSLNDDLKVNLLKKQLADNTSERIFEPTQNKEGHYYIPILTPIFSGQKYLGYLQANLSLTWFNEVITLDNKLKNMQIYFVSSNNEIVATNNEDFTIGDKINSICPTCPASSLNLNTSYNVSSSEISYCHPIFIDNQNNAWQICYKSEKHSLFKLVSYNFWNHFLIALFLLILTIGITIVFIDYLMRPFKMLISFAQKVAVGNFKCEQTNIKIERKDEFGQLQKAFRGISVALEETAEVSNAIASGDFTKTVKVKSDQDLLAKSINRMNNFLKQKQAEEERNKSEEEQQKWFNKGVSLMSEVIKSHQDNTEILANNIVKNLVAFLDISLGGIYIKELTDDEKIIYRLISAYAYSDKKFVDKKFQSGESLVGACASEKRIIYMSSIPEDYMKVFSGLGESPPQGLLLVPIIYNDEVFGVLELASLKEITEFEQKLILEVSDNIASTLSLSQISSQTASLLKKSRFQAKELENRDKEMINTLDELRKLQKETAKREIEIQAKVTAMNNSLLVVEYTIDGILLDANQKYLNSMGFTIEEIKGVNVLELLQEKEQKELIEIMNTVKRGNFYEAVVKRHTKYDKEKWLLATYTPVLDELGATSSILFFATDISRMVAKEQRLQKQISQLENDFKANKITETEIANLHAKQKEKIAELIEAHKNAQNVLFERMNTQKAEDANKLSSYEKMISEIVNQWSDHIDTAEKMIKKK